jgi:LacI family repressor for deo operon, udp, cdd, tsx, nupC, and nupG
LTPKRKPSSHDVAERAGVSRTTVSYVLNGRTDKAIPEETRARVLDAARALSYRSNRLANGILRGRTKLLGVVVPDLLNSFYARVLQGIHEECDRYGYSVLLTHSRNDVTAEQRRVELLMEYRVDGLVCVTYARREADIVAWAEETSRSGLPCVLLDHLPSSPLLDGVASHDTEGARTAVEHLIRLGHSRIAHLRGDQTVSTGVDRCRGYAAALRESGLPLDGRMVVGDHFLVEEGRKGLLALLDLPNPPTAVFAANDDIAEGALLALESRGLHAPGDVALVGYGNLEAMRGFGLTTIDQNPSAMGRRAVQCVLARLEDAEMIPQRILIATQLVVRRSCGASTAA